RAQKKAYKHDDVSAAAKRPLDAARDGAHAVCDGAADGGDAVPDERRHVSDAAEHGRQRVAVDARADLVAPRQARPANVPAPHMRSNQMNGEQTASALPAPPEPGHA